MSARPEAAIQRAIVQHLQARAVAGCTWLHVPNGGLRSRTEAAIFKGLGVRAGCSDLLLWHASRAFALELKAEHGRVSPTQEKFLQDMRAAGAEAAVTYGIDEALRQLERWQLLRGSVSA